MCLLRLCLPGLALVAASAEAQPVVTSPQPDRIAVTVYRDPQRSPDTAPNLEWLNGYALISEVRQIDLPAGESEIRFEGVAGGLIPQSAIVTGLPEGIVERNRDAYLLSPGTLLDRSLGRRVMIRRTSHATGAVRETEAVIRSGAAGGVVLQTPDGIEALRCTGLAEGLIFDEVPAGLSARPTLSVRTRSSQAVSATVTLSYLASGFDWQANYIANLSDDGRRVDLFAWLTLASTDETSFPDADTQAVAGQLNREPVEPQPREGGPLNLQCWPQQSTSDIPLTEFSRMDMRGLVDSIRSEDIVVTGTRMSAESLQSVSPVTTISAEQEELGDLKLYRIPEPVTVAANSQKQVALLQRQNVRASLVFRGEFWPSDAAENSQPAQVVLVTRNREAEGLGLPLPAGRLVLFGAGGGRPILLGEGSLTDLAINEDVEVYLGPAAGVRTRLLLQSRTAKVRRYELTVTNDHSRAIRFEGEFGNLGSARFRPRARLSRRDGMPLWALTIPANGSATLRFDVERDD